jgi:uncharacterized protein YndB with AHSA1/START domain
MSGPVAVRRSIRVGRPPEDAFRVFTEGMSRWWPDPSYGNSASFEARLGGRFVERLPDGRANRGEVTVWEPPHRVVFTWIRPSEPEVATEVDVRFTGEGDSTLVELEHRGFERLKDGAAVAADYDDGWPGQLEKFAQALAAASAS